MARGSLPDDPRQEAAGWPTSIALAALDRSYQRKLAATDAPAKWRALKAQWLKVVGSDRARRPRRWRRWSRRATSPPRASSTTMSSTLDAGKLDRRFNDARRHRLRRATAGRRLGARGSRALRRAPRRAQRARRSCFPAGIDGHAGGALCGDLIRVSVRVDGDRVVEAGFDADGCGALTAAGSAAVTLVEGELAARRRARGHDARSREELGGLSPGKLHAADLAADALHRALGAAARDAAGAAEAGPHAGRDERRGGLRRGRAARAARTRSR